MRTSRFRILVPAAVLAVLVTCPATPGADAPPATQPASAPAGEDIAVRVNGANVPVSLLSDLLIRAHGLDMVRHLVANELVRQEAGRLKLDVSDADVQAEHDRTLQRMFGAVAPGDSSPAAEKTAAAQREEMLVQLLTQQKVSRVQWDMAMRRSAVLRKLAEREVVVTDQEIRDEFENQFGRRVQVRHIQTATLTEAQKLLTELLGGGADFAQLARLYSTNASAKDGGLLPPFGKEGGELPVPPAIRQAALAMKKVGEISDPIQTGTAFHILKLEKIIEPQNVRYEDAREKLQAAIRERNILFLQPKILQGLIEKANIEYVHPVLKQQAVKGNSP